MPLWLKIFMCLGFAFIGAGFFGPLGIAASFIFFFVTLRGV